MRSRSRREYKRTMSMIMCSWGPFSSRVAMAWISSLLGRSCGNIGTTTKGKRAMLPSVADSWACDSPCVDCLCSAHNQYRRCT